jgi:glycosyltransferase involved in cell wall biosynthesis
VIPLYNERESIAPLWEAISDVAENLNRLFELIVVDDGSTDGSEDVLDELAAQNPAHITVIHLRGNFGKSAALAAGFAHARGDIVITMDGDLQDDPAEIPKLLEAIDSGSDVVCGCKRERRDPLRRVAASRVFNWLVRGVTATDLHDVTCGFKAMRKDAVAELTLYGELHRFIPVMASWRNFRVDEVVVHHRPREHGKSKFGLGRYFKGLVDLQTVSFLTRFDRRPAHFFAAVGGGISFSGFLICTYLSALWFMGERPIGNRPLLLLGVLLLVVGFQGIGLGLVAELVTRREAAQIRPYSTVRIAGETSPNRSGGDPLGDDAGPGNSGLPIAHDEGIAS